MRSFPSLFCPAVFVAAVFPAAVFVAAVFAAAALSPGTAHADVLLSVDFEESELGAYTPSDIDADWASQPGWSTSHAYGTDDLSIVELGGNRVLESTSPAGLAGGSRGGTFKVNFPTSYEELYMSFRVMFHEDFHFTLSGKMPRLQGGNLSACVPPTEGFSASVAWHAVDYTDTAHGSIHPYVYHVDQPNSCGQGSSTGGPVTSGEWHRVEAYVRMNTVGVADGVMTIWVDDEEVYHRSSYRYRDNAALAIERFTFKAAFGGPNTDEFRSIKDEHVYYDDFAISTVPIGLAGMESPDPGPGPDPVDPVVEDPSAPVVNADGGVADVIAGDGGLADAPREDRGVADVVGDAPIEDNGNPDMSLGGGCSAAGSSRPSGWTRGSALGIAMLWLWRRRRR